MADRKRTDSYLFAAGVLITGLAIDPLCWDRSVTIRIVVLSIVTGILLFRTRKLYICRETMLFGGVVLFSLFSGIQAVNKSEWLYGFLQLLLFWLFLNVSISCVDRRTIAYTLTGLTIICLIYAFFGPEGGLEGNKNPWAINFVLLVPFCYIAYPPIVMLSIMAVWLLFCRSAVLALFSMTVVKKKYAIIAVVILAVVVGIFHKKLANVESLQDRKYQWTASLAMAKENPFGVGSGNWKIEIPRYRKYWPFNFSLKLFNTYYYTRPHNDFLWLFAETSIFGMLCYIGFLGCAVYKARKDPPVLAGLMAFGVVSFFSFPLERPFLMVLMLIMVSLNARPARIIQVRYLPLAVCAFILFVGYRQNEANRMCLAVRLVNSHVKALEQLGGINWFGQVDRMGVPLYTYRGILRQAAKDSGGAVDDLRKANISNPYNPVTLYVYGDALSAVGRKTEGVLYRQRAITIQPTVLLTMSKAKTGAGASHPPSKTPPALN